MSVVKKASMVAISGWIIPAPLAAPPMVTVFPSTTKVAVAVFVLVSEVRMLDANSILHSRLA